MPIAALNTTDVQKATRMQFTINGQPTSVDAHDAAEAIRLAGANAAKYLGGGTNLVDVMRETIERPTSLIDVTGLSSAIEEQADGSWLIGAAAKNTAVAEHPVIRQLFPVLTRAIVAGASAHGRFQGVVL